MNSAVGTTGAAAWSWSSDDNALGVTGEYYGHAAYVPGYPTTQGPVYSTNAYGACRMAVITPLPPALSLLGSGLAGLGLSRGRKRFKA